jgi:hypothetical protein
MAQAVKNDGSHWGVFPSNTNCKFSFSEISFLNAINSSSNVLDQTVALLNKACKMLRILQVSSGCCSATEAFERLQ